MQKHQSGIALITAVLIVSLVAVAASSMATRQVLDIRRTENILHSEQAYAIAIAAEQFIARLIVDEDPDKNTDGEWEFALVNQFGAVGYNIDDVNVKFMVRDATAAFPLNNLANSDNAVSELYQTALRSLITTVLDQSFAPGLPPAIKDWVDANHDVTADGAEDNDYLLQSFPYRAANQPMASVSELRLLSAMLADDYIKLVPRGSEAPFLNALPVDGAPVTINLNTASREVLGSLHEQIEGDLLDDFMKTRETALEGKKAAFSKKSEFIDPVVDSVVVSNPITAKEKATRQAVKDDLEKLNLDIVSKYFEVITFATVGRIDVELHSLLKRDKNTVTTIRRGIGAI